MRPGSERAEIAAEFDVEEAPALRAWLAEQDFGAAGPLLLRRTLDAQGRSRAWINGTPATLAQLEHAGGKLVDLHGQHAHETLGRPDTQRQLVDAFGGFVALAREVAAAWRAWREECRAARTRRARDRRLDGRTRRRSSRRRPSLSRSAWARTNGRSSTRSQSRLANAADLLDAAAAGVAELIEGDGALSARLVALLQRLRRVATHDSVARGDHRSGRRSPGQR